MVTPYVNIFEKQPKLQALSDQVLFQLRNFVTRMKHQASILKEGLVDDLFLPK